MLVQDVELPEHVRRPGHGDERELRAEVPPAEKQNGQDRAAANEQLATGFGRSRVFQRYHPEGENHGEGR